MEGLAATCLIAFVCGIILFFMYLFDDDAPLFAGILGSVMMVFGGIGVVYALSEIRDERAAERGCIVVEDGDIVVYDNNIYTLEEGVLLCPVNLS